LRNASKNIAATHNHRYFHTVLESLADFFCNPLNRHRINAIANGRIGKRLPGEFEQDSSFGRIRQMAS